MIFNKSGSVEIIPNETEGSKCYIYNADRSRHRYTTPSTRRSPGGKRLPVGKYTVKCNHNGFKKFVPFAIEAREKTKLNIPFTLYSLRASGITPCVMIRYEVIGSDSRTVAQCWGTAREGYRVMLDPGGYTVEAALDDLNEKMKFTLENGGNISPIDFGLTDNATGIDGVWKTGKGKATLFSEGKKFTVFIRRRMANCWVK